MKCDVASDDSPVTKIINVVFIYTRCCILSTVCLSAVCNMFKRDVMQSAA